MVARLPILDGWRAISIILVLAGHWLPLNRLVPGLNHTASAAGMALFFTLSGFLIVSFLHNGEPLSRFVVKRLVRIVPLAWLAVALLALAGSYSWWEIARNLLFVANLPPTNLLEGGEHLWSLGVEMQFYALAAGLCLFGRRGLYLVPVLATAVTTARVWAGEPISIVTWHRVDEILAGGTLALLYIKGRKLPDGWAPLLLCMTILALTSHPGSGPLQYLRPYASAALVGCSLVAVPNLVGNLMINRPMRYVAEVSYAIYVFHGMLGHTWLGTGSKTEIYIKRPLLLLVTFGVAHVSTRFFEQPTMRLSRRLLKPSPTPTGVQTL